MKEKKEGKIIMKRSVELTEINNNSRYWLVRADGGKYYDDFKYNRFISVHHNELTLEKLSYDGLLLTEEKTLEKFKEFVFNEHKDDDWSKQKITSIAKRLHYFVESMSIGDYVVVPSHKSNTFLIGKIISNVYEIEQKDISNLSNDFKTVEDLKRRDVNWINEVPRYKMNSKFLYSTLTMHQSIIEVTQYAKHIDGLISPLYLKNGKMFLRLSVNTDRPITSEMWSSLYWMINNNKNKENNEQITVISNVESPGFIELASTLSPTITYLSEHPKESLSFGLISIAVAFGKVQILGVDIPGIVPAIQKVYTTHQENKKAKLETEKAELELQKRKKDVELDDLQRSIKLEQKRMELEKIQQQRRQQQNIQNFDITVDVPNVNYGDGQQTQTGFDEPEDDNQS